MAPPGRKGPSASDIRKVTKKYLAKKKTQDYVSDSDEDVENYLKLLHKNRIDQSKPSEAELLERLNTWTGGASDDEDASTAKNVRDTWGREAADYYDDALASDSDEQEEALELQLEEAKQIRRARMAALTKEDLEGTLSYYAKDEVTNQKSTEGSVGEFLALDVLLSGLVNSKVKEKSAEAMEGIDDAVISLAAQYLVWKERCQDESCAYLIYVRELGDSGLLELHDAVKSYLQMQLCATVWLGLVLHTVGAYGGQKVEIFSHAKSVARVLSKLNKLRKNLGGDAMFNLLRTELGNARSQTTPSKRTSDKSASEGETEDVEEDESEEEEDNSAAEEEKEAGSTKPHLSRLEAAIRAAEEAERTEARQKEEARLNEMQRVRDALRGTKAKKKSDIVEEASPVVAKTDDNEADSEPEESEAEAEKPAPMSKKSKREIREAREQLRRQAVIETLPQLPEEISEEGARRMNWEIAKNRGLTRKRKREDRHARLHYRAKFAKVARKASSTKMKSGPGETSGYSGEATGISMHVVRGRDLS